MHIRDMWEPHAHFCTSNMRPQQPELKSNFTFFLVWNSLFGLEQCFLAELRLRDSNTKKEFCAEKKILSVSDTWSLKSSAGHYRECGFCSPSLTLVFCQEGMDFVQPQMFPPQPSVKTFNISCTEVSKCWNLKMEDRIAFSIRMEQYFWSPPMKDKIKKNYRSLLCILYIIVGS